MGFGITLNDYMNSTGLKPFKPATTFSPSTFNVPETGFNKSLGIPGAILSGVGVLGGMLNNTQINLPRIGQSPQFQRAVGIANKRAEVGLTDAEINKYMMRVRRKLSGIRNPGSLLGEYSARTGLGGFATKPINQQTRAITEQVGQSYTDLLAEDSRVKRAGEESLMNLLLKQAEADYKAKLMEDQYRRQGIEENFGNIANLGIGLLSLAL